MRHILFSHIIASLRQTTHIVHRDIPTMRAITRRDMLKGGAILGGGVLASNIIPFTPAWADNGKKAPKIAIIGAGVAGLTTAYRLVQKGLRPTIFEASGRIGGRMFTKYDFNKSKQFCELGGELVDTNHTALRQLAKDLGVGIQNLDEHDPHQGEEIFAFEGKTYLIKDMLDPEKGTGAFIPLAKIIAHEQEKLLDENEEWTPYAKALDNISLHDYLERHKNHVAPWVRSLLSVAYKAEYGLEITEQSALNLVDFIGTDIKEPFKIFGESDEIARIKGGSSALINALHHAIKDKAHIRLYHTLDSLKNQSHSIKVGYKIKELPEFMNFDKVILTLPLTQLRKIKGIDTLGLPKIQHQAITQMGYGTNAKLLCSTIGRPWRNDKALPVPCNGSFYSDLPFQTTWETSRAQAGENGILTNFVGGKQGEATQEALLQDLLTGMKYYSPDTQKALQDKKNANVTSFFWAKYPFAEGSYPCPKVGQYTTLVDNIAQPACDGKLLFAGDYASPEFLGFMNGAIESAETVVEFLLRTYAKSSPSLSSLGEREEYMEAKLHVFG